MNFNQIIRAPLAIGIAAGLMASAAQAQTADDSAAAEAATDASANDGVAEIIVTAERRSVNVQKVAAAVSARSGEDLRRQGKYSLNQILENVPGVGGLTTTGLAGLGSDSPETGIAIRGVRSNQSGSQGLPVPSAVAVYVDGIFSGVGGNYDIDRVEVLRGPQGTLYGRSATGGVISTFTTNPNLEEVDGFGMVEVGTYGLRHYSAAAGAPLIEGKLGIRVSGDDYRQNGYISADGVGKTSAQNLRVKLLAKPMENLSILLGFAMNNTASGSGGVTVRQNRTPFEYTYDFAGTPLGSTKQRQRQYWAQIDWDLGGIHLTYIPALRDYKQAGSAPTIGPGGALLLQKINAPFDKFYTHELRLASDSTGRLTWQVGAISYNNTAKGFVNDITWLSSGARSTLREQDRKITQIGAFAEGTFALTDSTRLTGGVRYDKTKINTRLAYTQNTNRASNPGLPTAGFPVALDTKVVDASNGGKQEFKNFNYKARIEQDLGTGHLLYAGVSTGFIPGDVQVSSTTPPSAYVYAAETLTAYEVGSKNRFLGGKLQVNGSVYFYDYGGYQQTITPNLADSANILFVTIPARMYGGELELIARPTQYDEINLNVSHTTAHWVDRTAFIKENVAEKTIAGIIPTRANAAYTHTFAFANGSELRFRGELLYQSAYQVSNLTRIGRDGDPLAKPVPTLPFKPYTYLPHQFTGNISLDWTSADKKFGLTAYVRNVGDNIFPTGIALQTLTATTVTGSATIGTPPRTFGVIGRFNF